MEVGAEAAACLWDYVAAAAELIRPDPPTEDRLHLLLPLLQALQPESSVSVSVGESGESWAWLVSELERLGGCPSWASSAASAADAGDAASQTVLALGVVAQWLLCANSSKDPAVERLDQDLEEHLRHRPGFPGHWQTILHPVLSAWFAKVPESVQKASDLRHSAVKGPKDPASLHVPVSPIRSRSLSPVLSTPAAPEATFEWSSPLGSPRLSSSAIQPRIRQRLALDSSFSPNGPASPRSKAPAQPSQPSTPTTARQESPLKRLLDSPSCRAAWMKIRRENERMRQRMLEAEDAAEAEVQSRRERDEEWQRRVAGLEEQLRLAREAVAVLENDLYSRQPCSPSHAHSYKQIADLKSQLADKEDELWQLHERMDEAQKGWRSEQMSRKSTALDHLGAESRATTAEVELESLRLQLAEQDDRHLVEVSGLRDKLHHSRDIATELAYARETLETAERDLRDSHQRYYALQETLAQQTSQLADLQRLKPELEQSRNEVQRLEEQLELSRLNVFELEERVFKAEDRAYKAEERCLKVEEQIKVKEQESVAAQKDTHEALQKLIQMEKDEVELVSRQRAQLEREREKSASEHSAKTAAEQGRIQQESRAQAAEDECDRLREELRSLQDRVRRADTERSLERREEEHRRERLRLEEQRARDEREAERRKEEAEAKRDADAAADVRPERPAAQASMTPLSRHPLYPDSEEVYQDPPVPKAFPSTSTPAADAHLGYIDSPEPQLVTPHRHSSLRTPAQTPASLRYDFEADIRLLAERNRQLPPHLRTADPLKWAGHDRYSAADLEAVRNGSAVAQRRGLTQAGPSTLSCTGRLAPGSPPSPNPLGPLDETSSIVSATSASLSGSTKRKKKGLAKRGSTMVRRVFGRSKQASPAPSPSASTASTALAQDSPKPRATPKAPLAQPDEENVTRRSRGGLRMVVDGFRPAQPPPHIPASQPRPRPNLR